VNQQPVPVGIAEPGAEADTGVVGVAAKLDAGVLERPARAMDVGHPERERGPFRQRDREVAGLELGPVLVRRRVSREPECLTVELLGPRHVGDGQRDEVRALDVDHGVEPSENGA
jgi:hypothetical protein